MDRTTSNNGGKTKPLTPTALGVLRDLRSKNIPCRSINPGVVDRLTRQPNPLADTVDGPNPFPSSQKKEPKIPHLTITEAGRLELSSRGM